MSKIAIDFKANLSKIDGEEKTPLNIRTYAGVPVNLFDTYEENLEFYGANFIQDALTGTSILVRIQNVLRARSLLLKDDITVDTSEVIGKIRMWKDESDFLYSMQEIQVFADSFKPQMNIAAQKWQEEYEAAGPEIKAVMDAIVEQKAKASELKKQLEAFKIQQKSSKKPQGEIKKNRKQS